MTPQEISEYKSKWMSESPYVSYVYDWHHNRTFCKVMFKPESWKAVKFACPDDAHAFFFERREDYVLFVENSAS